MPDIKERQGKFQRVSFGHVPYHLLWENGYVSDHFHQTAFKFTFVRNPYDRAVSLYEYYLKTNKITQQTFLEFLTKIKENGVAPLGLYNQSGWSQCNPQVRWTEHVELDFIGRFENLEGDLAEVVYNIGLELPDKLPRLNKTVDTPWQSYYDVQEKEIVEEFYKEDFEVFGYSIR